MSKKLISLNLIQESVRSVTNKYKHSNIEGKHDVSDTNQNNCNHVDVIGRRY